MISRISTAVCVNWFSVDHMSMFAGAGPKHGPAYSKALHLEARWDRPDPALSAHWNQVIIPLRMLSTYAVTPDRFYL